MKLANKVKGGVFFLYKRIMMLTRKDDTLYSLISNLDRSKIRLSI